ncbi:hypothetical protein QR98_0079310 [Sarcoptes scabiei]|uniref:DUF7042 domain-containing protein n=1 Tax=Sarcoptes scabiei TaxID=52283 RepID=A0A132AEP2_SARSC|nr:hypothetical protein QR98_0079310 [Sarcoptes scabiei]
MITDNIDGGYGKHIPGGLQSIEHVFCPFNGRFRFTYTGNNGKHIPGGLQSIEHVFCPFNGRFRFTYTGNNGKLRCDSGYSEMSNCPHGNALNVKFRKCSFNTMDIHFLCLGDWEASNSNNNERYLALMDLRESLETNRPKYRCGI